MPSRRGYFCEQKDIDMKVEKRHKKQCNEGAKKVSLTTETVCRNFVLREAETTLSLPCKRCVVPLRSNMIKNDSKIRLLPNAQKCLHEEGTFASKKEQEK